MHPVFLLNPAEHICSHWLNVEPRAGKAFNYLSFDSPDSNSRTPHSKCDGNMSERTPAQKYDFSELELVTEVERNEGGQQNLPWDLSTAAMARGNKVEQSFKIHGVVDVEKSAASTTTAASTSLKTPARCGGAGGPRRYAFQQQGSSRSMTTAVSSSTKRTSLTGTTPRAPKPSVIAAVVEGRGHARGEIGMATMDLKNPQIVLSQFSDTQTYIKTITKLKIVQPLEILMPNSACESGNPTRFFKQLSDFFSLANIVTVQRRYFNEAKGLQYVKQLRIPDCKTVELEVASKFYCLASVAALLKYIEFIQNVFYVPNSLKVVFRGSENTAMIDFQTANVLELVVNLKDPKSEHTLYGVLHCNKTVGGSRLLRANILQPPCDRQTIDERLECVSELLENQEMFFNLRTVLCRFIDIDHLLSMCVQIPKQETVRTAENKITYVIYLKHTLELVAPLKTILENCRCQLLKAYQQSLDDPRYTLILSKINEIIHEDAKYQKGTLNMRSQKCFAVKPHINGLLDVARRSYGEIVDDISSMILNLSQEFNLPLRSCFQAGRGFYIQICCGRNNPVDPDQLPPVFIKKAKVKNTIRCTTEALVKFNGRVDEALNEIYLMSNVIISKLLNDILHDIGCLYRLTEIVSTLDMLVGFAQACALSNYARPEFTDTLAIKAGRHPILERVSPEAPVPNNAYLADGDNFAIITGPNMSGKSTYLKQVALMQVMAQVGCFVPAEYASFRLTDHIFSRKGSSDDIETNSSTFMMEMQETNYILRTASDTSLIIIDELGRGTGVEEGIGLCYAICEDLLKLKAFTLFTTHFTELTSLDSVYPNVCNYHFGVERDGSGAGVAQRLLFTHSIEPGPTTELNYGVSLAELSALPPSIVSAAKDIARAAGLRSRADDRSLLREAARTRAAFVLSKRLLQAARNSRLDTRELLPYLASLKEHYLQQVEHVEAAEDDDGV